MRLGNGRAARIRPAAAALAAAILAILGVAYYLTYEPAPAVDIRWREGVSAEQRAAVERRFGLRAGRFRERRTFTYDLLDTRSSNIRSLLEQPEVEDSGRFDLRTYTVRPDAPYGERWMWIGDRLPLLRIRPVAWGIVGCCAAIVATYGFGRLVRRRHP